MLKDMCREALSQAEINAIGKARGFSAKETSSRANFESIFLSHIGLDSAFASLSKDEIAILHLLKYRDEKVDIAFFQHIYGKNDKKKSYYFETYTARYKDVFSKVKSSLVRKGVILMAERKIMMNSSAKMERWRFRFPKEFEKFLPSPLDSTSFFDTPGQINDDALRNMISKVTKIEKRNTKKDYQEDILTVSENELSIGEYKFSVSYLRRWQRKKWRESLGLKKPKDTISPLETILYSFSQLKPNEWCLPEDLKSILNIFSKTVPSNIDKICASGWDWGCISKHTANNKTYYRLTEEGVEEEINPGRYLTNKDGNSIAVDLQTVPYGDLELISKISGMEIRDSRLIFCPDLIKIGKASDHICQQPLYQWLKNNSQAFKKTIETVDKRRGKQIVHDNLLIARINDLSLKVKIEKKFPGQNKLVSLSEEYIAFTADILKDIEGIVKKSGHVVNRTEVK